MQPSGGTEALPSLPAARLRPGCHTKTPASVTYGVTLFLRFRGIILHRTPRNKAQRLQIKRLQWVSTINFPFYAITDKIPILQLTTERVINRNMRKWLKGSKSLCKYAVFTQLCNFWKSGLKKKRVVDFPFQSTSLQKCLLSPPLVIFTILTEPSSVRPQWWPERTQAKIPSAQAAGGSKSERSFTPAADPQPVKQLCASSVVRPSCQPPLPIAGARPGSIPSAKIFCQARLPKNSRVQTAARSKD